MLLGREEESRWHWSSGGEFVNGSLKIEHPACRSSAVVKLIDEITNDDGLLIREIVQAFDLQNVPRHSGENQELC